MKCGFHSKRKAVAEAKPVQLTFWTPVCSACKKEVEAGWTIRKLRGFTIIEMAIVLFIMSIIAVGATQFAVGAALSAKYSVIHQNFDTLKGGIVWNSFKGRACDPAQPQPCNTVSFSYAMPPAGSTFAGMGFGVTLTKDPWGNDYRYTVTTPIVSPASLPGDVAFTMTSAGVDGVFGTVDDLKQQILVSELQALFSRF